MTVRERLAVLFAGGDDRMRRGVQLAYEEGAISLSQSIDLTADLDTYRHKVLERTRLTPADLVEALACPAPASPSP